MFIEYKVRPVTRYLVTRFKSIGDEIHGSVGSSLAGEFVTESLALDVAHGLGVADQQRHPNARVEFPSGVIGEPGYETPPD